MEALLISTDLLKHRMAIDPALQGIEDSLESAIHAAQLHIEAIYGSRLSPTSNSDIFFIDPTYFSGIAIGGLYRLLLTNAFVKPSSLKVSAGDSWNSTTTEVPDTDYKLIADRGVLLLDKSYADKHIQVVYDSGFDSPAETYDWVKEAILSFAPVVFNFGQTTNRNDEAEKGYKASAEHAVAVVSPYRRNTGFMYRPLK